MRIALIATCLGDALFPDVPKATVALLERLGHEVIFPPAQVCCGQMHVNTGYLTEALPWCDITSRCSPPPTSTSRWHRRDHAWARSGTNTPMVARRGGDTALAERATASAAPTYELSELLVDVLGLTDVGAYYPHRVTYHPTCHSLRMLHVGDKPLSLLRAVQDIDLVDLPQDDTCCGFGGTFALKNSDTSSAMLADKITNVLSTGAELCSAGDSSCLMHINGGLFRSQTRTRTVHLATILASTKENPA